MCEGLRNHWRPFRRLPSRLHDARERLGKLQCVFTRCPALILALTRRDHVKAGEIEGGGLLVSEAKPGAAPLYSRHQFSNAGPFVFRFREAHDAHKRKFVLGQFGPVAYQLAQFDFEVGEFWRCPQGSAEPCFNFTDEVMGRGWRQGLGLVLDRCAPELRAKLSPVPAVVAPVEAGVERPVQRVEDWQIAEQLARFAIITPALKEERGTRARADALRAAAGRVHDYPGGRMVFGYAALHGWMRAYEARGLAGLIPAVRRDMGKGRVVITRLWDTECGLDDLAKAKVKQALDRKAAGYVAKDNTSRRILARVFQAELMRLTAEAGSPVPLADLRRVCVLNGKWAQRFERFRLVFQHDRDHKTFSDRHEARITRKMEEVPMDVVMGDVHHVDMWIAPLADPVTVKLIGWMDAASAFRWATPVIVNKRQSVTQEDVAKSLFEVCACPWAGMPRTFILDNGSEYSALTEAMGRLSALSDMQPGFRVIKCRPYSPESKGRLEGAFNIFKGIIKGLPGYIGGDRMKKPTQSKGRPVAPGGCCRGARPSRASGHDGIGVRRAVCAGGQGAGGHARPGRVADARDRQDRAACAAGGARTGRVAGTNGGILSER